MTAAGRAFGEWWSDVWGDDFPNGVEFDKEDLADAFVSGWAAAMGAEWETSAVQMLGIEGGEKLGPAHPGAPR